MTPEQIATNKYLIEQVTPLEKQPRIKLVCPKCKHHPYPNKCESFIETESWEMPWIKYRVYICPYCGADCEER